MGDRDQTQVLRLEQKAFDPLSISLGSLPRPSFLDRVSLCSPGYPGTNSVDQAGPKLRDPPVSASGILGTMPGLFQFTLTLSKVLLVTFGL